MKNLLFLSIGLLTLLHEVNAQKVTFNKMMKSALHMHDTASTWLSEKAVAEFYDSIVEAYPEEWLSAYWSCYIYTQLTNSLGRAPGSPDNVKQTDLLNDAQSRLDLAVNRYKGDSVEILSDLHVMQSFIYLFHARFGDEKGKDNFQNKADSELKKALNYNSRNPLAYVLIGTEKVRSNDFKDVISGHLLLNKAKEIFSEVNEHRALTTQWNEEWLRFFWLKHADKQVEKATAMP